MRNFRKLLPFEKSGWMAAEALGSENSKSQDQSAQSIRQGPVAFLLKTTSHKSLGKIYQETYLTQPNQLVKMTKRTSLLELDFLRGVFLILSTTS